SARIAVRAVVRRHIAVVVDGKDIGRGNHLPDSGLAGFNEVFSPLDVRQCVYLPLLLGAVVVTDLDSRALLDYASRHRQKLKRVAKGQLRRVKTVLEDEHVRAVAVKEIRPHFFQEGADLDRRVTAFGERDGEVFARTGGRSLSGRQEVCQLI